MIVIYVHIGVKLIGSFCLVVSERYAGLKKTTGRCLRLAIKRPAFIAGRT